MSKSRVGESLWGGEGGAASSWASPSQDTRTVSADQGGAAKISGAVISKFWLPGRFGAIRKQTQSYCDMSMSRGTNLSQRDVEEVGLVGEMFQNIDPVCAAGQFFTAMKVNRMRMQTFADCLPIFLFHEL